MQIMMATSTPAVIFTVIGFAPRWARSVALDRKLDFTTAVGEDVFAPVGAGSIDMAGVLGTLRDAGFDGWLIVEQDIRIAPGSSREPKLDAAKSYSFVTAELG